MVYGNSTKAESKPVATKPVAEDFLHDVKAVYPADVLTYSEQVYDLAAAAEKSLTEMFTSIGIEELAIFEATGKEVIYEENEEAKEKITEKVVKFFKDLWERIKGVYVKVIEKINDKVTKADKELIGFVDKNLVAIRKMGDRSFGKIHKIAKGLDGVAAGWGRQANNLITNSEYDKEAKEIISDIFGQDAAGAESIGEVAKKVKEKFLGTETVEIKASDFKTRLPEIRDVVDGRSIRTAIKKNYNEQKAQINNAIARAKKAKAENYKQNVKKMTQVVTIADAGYKALLDVFRTNFTECRMILASAARAVKKGAGAPEAKEEKGEEKKEEQPKEEKKEETKTSNESVDVSALFAW